MPSNKPTIPIRVDQATKDEYTAAAESAGQTLNAYIIERLEQTGGQAAVTLRLDQVTVDNTLNPREGALDQGAVQEYAAHIDELPPMTVYQVGEEYLLVAGFHRIAAHELVGCDTGRFIVRQGDRDAAAEYADLDNLKHGIQLTRREKRAVIGRHLKRYGQRSDVWIAKDCHTTDKTVRSVRQELEQAGQIETYERLQDQTGTWRPRSAPKPDPAPVADDELPSEDFDDWFSGKSKASPTETLARATAPDGAEWLPEPEPEVGQPAPLQQTVEAASPPAPEPPADEPKPAPPPPPPPPPAAPKIEKPREWQIQVTLKAIGRGDCLITLAEGPQALGTEKRNFETMLSGILTLVNEHIPAEYRSKWTNGTEEVS